VEFASWTEQSEEIHEIDNVGPFGYFSLDMSDRDLFSAWDVALHSANEDFITPGGYESV